MLCATISSTWTLAIILVNVSVKLITCVWCLITLSIFLHVIFHGQREFYDIGSHIT